MMFSRELIKSITGPVVQRDRNWYYEPNALWYEENGRPTPISDEIIDETLSKNTSGGSGSSGTTAASNGSSGWNVVRKKRKKQALTSGETPPFNIQELANLTDYAMVIAKYEQPQWRKNLLKKFGPLGMEKKGYNDLSKAS